MGRIKATSALARAAIVGVCFGALAASAGADAPTGSTGATGATGPTGPVITQMSNLQTVTYYGHPQALATVRSSPADSAGAVAKLHWLTEDGQDEVYVVLQSEVVSSHTWLQIEVPRRPNGTIGWVPASALDPLYIAHGHIVVNRETEHITYFNGHNQAVFSAPAGVGRPSLPTPAGQFYVREKLVALAGDPAYGPFALGTSAYAFTTDWPGGGVVGIHGTDQPSLIPGRPSHGCIRLKNSAITRLWNMVSIGTPIDIT